MPRGRGVPALLAGLLAIAPSQVLSAQLSAAVPEGEFSQDTVLLQAVIEVSIERGPRQVMAALAYNSTLLLPVRQFLALVEVRIDVFEDGDSVVAVREPNEVAIRFAPARRRVSIGDTELTVSPLDVVWQDGELYAATAILDRALEIETHIDWAGLAAAVTQTASLPVIQRARRERRQAQLRPAGPTRQGLELETVGPVVDGAVVSWLATGSTGASQYASLDLAAGAGLLGGSAELRPRFWSSFGGGDAEFRASWTRAWTDSRWVQQLRIGDVQTNGRRARLIRGLAVTNAPFVRASEFDLEVIQGAAPPGWEYEVYYAGRLASYGVSDALGMFRVPLELRYGQNPYELIAYGPSGEINRDRRTIRVPFSRIPTGKLEYAVSGGACSSDPCDGMMAFDARYGVSRRITVQGGSDVFFDGLLGTLWQPYALASAAMLPSLSLTGEFVLNGHVRGIVAFEPTLDLRVSGSHAEISESGSRYLSLGAEARRTDLDASWRPGLMRRNLILQLAGFRSSGNGASREVVRMSTTTRLGPARYTLGLLLDRASANSIEVANRFTIDGSASTSLRGPIAPLRGSTLRAAMAFEPAEGLAAIQAQLGRRFRRILRGEIGLGWFRQDGFTLELNISTNLPGPRVATRSRVSDAGGAQSTVFSTGSVVWDRQSSSVLWSDGSDVGRSGVGGILYRDDNANGRRDSGEPGIPGIPIFVGGNRGLTDAEGRFSVWDVVPFELVDIEVDSLAFDDPRFVPPNALLRVRPTPNRFNEIAVPVVMGAEVSGFVVFQNEGLGDIPMVLRELSTGREMAFTTFADGGFYAPAVPPGEYEVLVPDVVLERLGAYVPPQHIFVPPGIGEKKVDQLVFFVEPLQP